MVTKKEKLEPVNVSLDAETSIAKLVLTTGKKLFLKEPSAAKLLRVGGIMTDNGLSSDMDAMFAMAYICLLTKPTFDEFLDSIEEMEDVERLGKCLELFPNIKRKLSDLKAISDRRLELDKPTGIT